MARGQLGIQFNWIFALVGGILFLLFFFIVIRTVLQSGEEREQRQLTFDVESAVATSPSNAGAFTILDVRDGTYSFVCSRENGEVVESFVRPDRGPYNPQGLRYVPLFSAGAVEGDRLFLATKVWEIPFPATALVLLGNNRTGYVHVADPAQRRLVEEFLDNGNLRGFDSIIVTPGELDGIPSRGLDHRRFVFWNTAFRPIQRFAADTALVIRTTESERGDLQFYDSMGAGATPSEASYYGSAMLAAAIFSEDRERFACEMAKAGERLATAREILRLRTELFMTQTDEPCTTFYDRVVGALDTLPEDPLALGTAPSVEQLVQLNKQLLSRNCPLVY